MEGKTHPPAIRHARFIKTTRESRVASHDIQIQCYA